MPLRSTAYLSALGLASLLLAVASAFAAPAAEWRATVGPQTRGTFPVPSNLSAKYRFGWSGITAATGDMHLTKRENRLQLACKGRTVGLARALWRLDATYDSIIDARQLRPLRVEQVEKMRDQVFLTNLAFDSDGVVSRQTEIKQRKEKTRERTFEFSPLHDLFSSVMHVRSLPLANSSTNKLVVYPATSAYLATTRVLGREKIRVGAGTFDAIKIDLQLKNISKKGTLQPHKKFKRATVWLSDDHHRMLLRVEAQIFIGTVFADMQSTEAQPTR